MSVIAAMVYPEKIVMAADSIMVKDWSKSTSGDFSKINEDNGMIIGGCGSAQELSLMWHYMATHKPSASTCKGVLAILEAKIRNEKQPKKKFELVQHLHLLQAQRNGEEKR